ncbi:MAG: thioredoxin domain-containing protein [Candidatus Marinimicrobia bacterium]|nr:thioredoxin domain-containing protein [Candidatus Neomarinimicrobiota bacterium]
MHGSHPSPNRLAKSSSPYLLQHAYNPVDWYPWGEEAFEKARLEDKPIFLSIGYSTCHWCHVMAHESFEDEAVAKLMNDNYVCIKVDREERPDIDQVYMAAASTLIGRGGWPLTIVMSPDKRPFFAGTYFPKESTPGRVGMLDLLPRITEAWKTQREEIEDTADQIINSLQQKRPDQAGELLDEDVLVKASSDFNRNYDSARGGFGSAPKFPSPHNLVFLLREGYRTGDSTISNMALHSLKQMRLGGIFDHIGFGFHRYSTDANWHVPHFEKMLYDQVNLMLAYTEAWELSRDPLFLQTVEEIFVYLSDKLKSDSGAYYSAEDADSEGEEGKFYVWSWEELQDVMNEQELATFAPIFGLRNEGNFDDEASRRPSGLNIFDIDSDIEYEHLVKSSEWVELRKKLYQIREDRIHPGLDNKILADWNGLALSALSRAASATGEQRYRQAASDLAKYLRDEIIQGDDQLLHMPAAHEVKVEGFLDDYSFIIQGFRNYYETTFEAEYLKLAIQLQKTQLTKFWDQDGSGFFFTEAGDSDLFMRQKEIYDGAIPSGNSVAAENLYYLGRLAENPEWELLSRKIGETFSEQVNRAPRGFSALLQSTQAQVNGTREIVIAGDLKDLADARAVLRKFYDPFKLTLYRPNQDFDLIEDISGFLSYQKAIDGGLTVYICEDYACQYPATDIPSLEKTLRETIRD